MDTYLFTVRLRPYEGESLSSFIYRLAIANGTRVFQIWNTMKTKHIENYAQRDDINLLDFAPVNTIDTTKLAQSLSIDVEKLLNCSCFNILQTFSGETNIERSRFLSGMLRTYLYYCPLCLRVKCYNRLLWKIDDIHGCVEHGNRLLNQCSSCQKYIKYKDILVIGECPYCEHKLFRDVTESIIMSEEELCKESWFTNTWAYLLKDVRSKIETYEIGMRILFILNQRKLQFDKHLVEKNLKEPGILPALLQHARESLSHKRTLHISFILSVLFEHQISAKEFMELETPAIFIDSVKTVAKSKKDSVSCFAPWCSSYNKVGSLIKTGTTLKRRKSGKVLKYYLFCTSCGCEYAFDEEDQLIERGFFIEVYKKLLIMEDQDIKFKQLSNLLEITEDKLRRSLSYFRTRINLRCDIKLDKYKIEKDLINSFTKSLVSNMKIKDIQQWECWDSYEHFLTYRFQVDVMNAISMQERTFSKRSDINSERKRVYARVKYLFETDKDITIASVVNELDICPETLRIWDCLSYIAEMKKGQKEKRLLEMKEKVYNLVDEFFDKENENELSVEGLYQYIGTGRTVLWRVMPEITAYIGERFKKENYKVRNGGNNGEAFYSST